MNSAALIIIFIILSVLDNAIAGALIECRSDDDCSAKSSSCINNLCTCKEAGNVLNSMGTECVKLAKHIGEKCDETHQCAFITGSVDCISGECKCDKYSVYIRGKCIERKRNADSCQSHEECFDGIDINSRSCIDSKCACSPGYYWRGSFDCRKERKIGDYCSIDSDCIEKHVACDEGVCKTKSLNLNTTVSSENTEYEMIDEPNTSSTFAEVPCSDDSQCEGDHYSCSKIFGTCVCAKGYSLDKKNKCVAELGMECDNDESCLIKNSECVNGVCSCKEPLIWGEYNQKCTKRAFSPSFTCVQDASCSAFGENYFCETIEARKQCVCSEGYTLDTETLICIDGCLCDNECKLENSMCRDSKCVCKTGYTMQNGQCQPKLNSPCENDDQCTSVTTNSECSKEKICVCRSGMVNNANENCLPKVDIGNECEIDSQCYKSQSLCRAREGESKQCVCENNYVNVLNNCLFKSSGINDVCYHPKQCEHLTNSVCVKSECSCPDGMIADPRGMSCLKEGNFANKQSSPFYKTVSLIVLVNLYFTNA